MAFFAFKYVYFVSIVWLLAVKVLVNMANEQIGFGNELVAAGVERSKRAVLFPQYTILQVTMAVVIPIEVPKRKVGLNLALQCNFNLPYTPKEFYKPPYWATRSSDGSSGRSDNDFAHNNRSSRSLHENNQPPYNLTAINANGMHFGDLSSAEFYSLVKNYLAMEGYEDDCLEKAICEMGKHPLEHQPDNLLSELIHFIFRPSQHDNSKNETFHLHTAENHGLNAGDCDLIYRCRRSPLEHLTVLEEEEDDDVDEKKDEKFDDE